MMPGTARFVEIWNGPWFGGNSEKNSNEQGLALWYGWLNQGLRRRHHRQRQPQPRTL
ncbi:MAG: hypothetical protein R2856_20590 [Caldilineaceae bacterium]